MTGEEAKALRALFGKALRPRIEIASHEIAAAARKAAGRMSISGVQPKLSMQLDGDRLVPAAGGGLYLLKPETQEFAEVPANEALCMAMGRRFGLRTAPCALLALSDQAPAYVVRRFDRVRSGRRLKKLACEDMQQILGGPDKYAGSHEQIAEAIRTHCTFFPLELQRYFETVIFCFAVGNGDAHRKNFSLLTAEDGTVALSPAYDLVSSRLAIPEESEELALSLNGKRNRLRRSDFLEFADTIGVPAAHAERRIAALLELQAAFLEMIERSKLGPAMRERLREILDARLARLRGG